MPWELQVCRFCGKGYGHKTGLRKHLSQYVGGWRIPADGIHDVLEIQEILYADADQNEYQCPFRDCQKIIATRQKFTEHVITEKHWGGVPESTFDEDSTEPSKNGDWILPFDEDTVKVFKPKGCFPFLRLPPELRLIVYEMTLCYGGIQFLTMQEDCASVRRCKAYLQCNSDNNPLSLLITSRGIYEEARTVFYSKNEFLFTFLDALPIFLIGIGQANAMLLRSVRWWRSRSENQISVIRPYILGIDGQDPTIDGKLNIWNDHRTYADFLEKIGRTSCIEPLPEPHRFLHWNPNNSSRASRVRHHLRFRFLDNTYDRLEDISDVFDFWTILNTRKSKYHWHRLGDATYELISHVEKSGRP